MRHQKSGRKLNMSVSHRDAMFRNMVTSLFKHRRIETTDARAKELRQIAERMITFAKKGDLHARRQVIRIITDRKVVHELFDEIGPHFAERNGGYTRIIKAGRRRGDNAPLSLIELVGMEPKIEELEEKVEKKRQKKDEKVKAAQQAAAEAEAEAKAEAKK
ncbi:MAG: 50S ribosomal protein L17 [Candidatus Eisenbacteria bacterium]